MRAGRAADPGEASSGRGVRGGIRVGVGVLRLIVYGNLSPRSWLRGSTKEKGVNGPVLRGILVRAGRGLSRKVWSGGRLSALPHTGLLPSRVYGIRREANSDGQVRRSGRVRAGAGPRLGQGRGSLAPTAPIGKLGKGKIKARLGLMGC